MQNSLISAILLSAVSAVTTPYISGQVTTWDTVKYGKFVAKVLAPDEKGTTTGFFSQWTGPNWDYKWWQSIEMEVVPSLEGHPLSLDLSYGDGNDRLQSMSDNRYEMGYTWRVQEFTWKPDEVTFSVDGVLLKRFGAGDPYVYSQNKPQNIMLNLWVPRYDAHEEDWSVGRDDSTMPWYAKFDYVEYYSWDPATDSFHLAWRDDFDYLDEQRWKVQDDTSTFDQSLSTYVKSQVYTDDSQLVLKLEKSGVNNHNPWEIFLQ